jgi:hypothetical protein
VSGRLVCRVSEWKSVHQVDVPIEIQDGAETARTCPSPVRHLRVSSFKIRPILGQLQVEQHRQCIPSSWAFIHHQSSKFFCVAQQYKKRGCTSKSECDGVPVSKKLKASHLTRFPIIGHCCELLRKKKIQAPSNDGKLKFIGCTKWAKTEPWTHTYAAIPADVDESLLAKFLSGSALPPAELEEHDGDGYCVRFTYPRHGKKTQCREWFPAIARIQD